MIRLLFFFALLLSGCATAQKPAREQPGHYAEINGLHTYYELHGKPEGIPLLLINGGGSDINVTWGRILPFLAQDHYVIAFDGQAHGRTGDRNAPLRFETSAEDAASLLKFLKIEKADVFGFSNGASVALALTLKHPELVHKLVFAGSMTKRSGAPKLFDFFKNPDFAQMPQPLKDAFLRVNPDPAKLHNMFEKDVEQMRNFQETSDRELKTIKTPTLVLAGDRDILTVDHAVELTHLIKGSRLIILEGVHGEYLGEILGGKPGSKAPRLTAELVSEFLRE